MGRALKKIIEASVIACSLGMGSLGPALAGSAGAADSRGPERQPEGDSQRDGAGGSNRAFPRGQREGNWSGDGGGAAHRGEWNGQREGGWRGGDGEGHRHEGGFGWAPFVFGGFAAGALAESATPRYYGQPYDAIPAIS